MKLSRSLGALFVLTLIAVPEVFGAGFGVRAGRYNDAEEEFVGVEVAFGEQIEFVPNVEYILTDEDVTQLTGNADLLFNFGRSTVRPYIGAGVGVLYTDTDFGDSTDALFNVIGGLKFNLDFLQPYAQVKYFRLFEDGGGDDIAFTVGLRF